MLEGPDTVSSSIPRQVGLDYIGQVNMRQGTSRGVVHGLSQFLPPDSCLELLPRLPTIMDSTL